MPHKIIIDTDPGIDDAMAIFYALHSPELEVLGFTTVFGNVYTELATTNALRLLEIAGQTDVPVAESAPRPLVMAFYGPADFVHGKDGQGNVNLPAPQSKAVAKKAHYFIIDEVMKTPHEVTLVPIGPLTNIALALTLEPRLAANIKKIVLMGGNAYHAGNATPAAEANIWNDPEAAEMVFGADCPITMVGLDVTEMVFMPVAVLDTLETSNKKIPSRYDGIGWNPHPRFDHDHVFTESLPLQDSAAADSSGYLVGHRAW